MISIRKYKTEDREMICKLVGELQEYLIGVDPLKKLRKLPGFEEKNIDNLLKKIGKQNGIIFVAYIKNTSCGFIAGVTEEYNEDRLLEYVPTKSGRILELIVSEKYRGKNIGRLLIEEIEEYFQQQNCDVVRVEVFVNNPSHDFYKKVNFNDRNVDMIKKISNIT